MMSLNIRSWPRRYFLNVAFCPWAIGFLIGGVAPGLVILELRTILEIVITRYFNPGFEAWPLNQYISVFLDCLLVGAVIGSINLLVREFFISYQDDSKRKDNQKTVFLVVLDRGDKKEILRMGNPVWGQTRGNIRVFPIAIPVLKGRNFHFLIPRFTKSEITSKGKILYVLSFSMTVVVSAEWSTQEMVEFLYHLAVKKSQTSVINWMIAEFETAMYGSPNVMAVFKRHAQSFGTKLALAISLRNAIEGSGFQFRPSEMDCVRAIKTWVSGIQFRVDTTIKVTK